MEERLAGIESTLQNLSSSIQQMAAIQTTSIEMAPPHPARPAATTLREESSFEGTTSLQAHSLHATQIAEQAINDSLGANQSPELLAALTSLKKLLDRQSMASSKELQFSTKEPIDSSPRLRKDMPPLVDTSAVVKRAKGAFQSFHSQKPSAD